MQDAADGRPVAVQCDRTGSMKACLHPPHPRRGAPCSHTPTRLALTGPECTTIISQVQNRKRQRYIKTRCVLRGSREQPCLSVYSRRRAEGGGGEEMFACSHAERRDGYAVIDGRQAADRQRETANLGYDARAETHTDTRCHSPQQSGTHSTYGFIRQSTQLKARHCGGLQTSSALSLIILLITFQQNFMCNQELHIANTPNFIMSAKTSFSRVTWQL